MGFDALPAELLLNISSFLSQVDLLNVSLTNKKFRGSSEPELYRDYINASKHRDRQKRSLRLYVRHLVDRPHLAKHVRRVELSNFSHLVDLVRRPRGCLEPMECTQAEYEHFAQAAQAFNVITNIISYADVYFFRNELVTHFNGSCRFREKPCETGHQAWFNAIMKSEKNENVTYDVQFCTLLLMGFDDAFVVLLMALAPKIRNLQLGNTFFENLSWRVDHQFRSLRRLVIGRCNDNMVWPSWFYDTVMRGGQLETLLIKAPIVCRNRVRYLGGLDATMALSLDLQTTHINHLRLYRCRFSKDSLQIILKACPTLKLFSYIATWGNENPHEVTLEELIECLHIRKETLEEVEIDHNENLSTCPSMHSFKALHYLTTRVCMWKFPSDESICQRLPPNMKTIKILETFARNQTPRRHYPLLHTFISQCHIELPNLESIIYVEENCDWTKAVFRYMVADARLDEHGIQVTFIKDHNHVARKNPIVEHNPDTLQRDNITEWNGEKYICEKSDWQTKPQNTFGVVEV